MAEATLGRLELRGLVPRSLGPRPAAALEQALAGEPFRDALAAAFGVLADLDPGAVWVLRRLDVRLAVPFTEPDPARQARRVAAALAESVAKVVAGGPSSEAVRFTSRAGHVAAYLRARLRRHGDGWVFQRFSALSPLPVADALMAAARVADADLLDVVTGLVVDGSWAQLVATATRPEGERVAAALERRAAGASPGSGTVAEVARVRDGILAAAVDAGTAAPRASVGSRARLELLGEAAAARPVTAELVAAAWRVQPAPPEAAPGSAAAPLPGRPAAGARDRGPAPGVPAAPGPAAAPGWPEVAAFAAAGAPVFLLLPDLAALLAGEPALLAAAPAAAAVRAIVLGAVLGEALTADDPAVAVASGLSRPPEPEEMAALLSGPVAAWARRLSNDPVVGWQHPADPAWVAAVTAGQPGLSVAAIALLRSFARHLAGFGRAGPAHLVPQVLPAGGVIRVSEELVEAVLPAGPLHVLLAMAGLDAFTCRVPWLPARVVASHEAGP